MTSFEVDTVRIDLNSAVERFKETILPATREQDGYQGILVLTTPDGKGLLISLWESDETAARGIESGYYEQQVASFVTFLKQPPGRDHYEVRLHETR